MEGWKHIGSLLVGVAALMTAGLGILSYFQEIQKESISKVLEISNSRKLAIVNDPDGWVNLRNEPSTSSSILVKAFNGTEVELISLEGNWYFVKIKNKEGYIYRDRLQLLFN